MLFLLARGLKKTPVFADDRKHPPGLLYLFCELVIVVTSDSFKAGSRRRISFT